MKRSLFLLGAGLLLASSAQAQLGVRAGGNTVLFTKGEYPGNVAVQRRAGFQVGLFYQVPLTKHLSLVPEVQVSREFFAVDNPIVLRPAPTPGVISDYVDNSLGYSYDQSLSYLNLPLLLRANLGPLYLEAGPQFSWLVGGRTKGTQAVDNGSQPYRTVAFDLAATTQYHRFDAGFCVGLGARLPAGLGVGVRAYWGATQLSEQGYSPQTYADFQRRQTLQASLTYQLAAH